MEKIISGAEKSPIKTMEFTIAFEEAEKRISEFSMRVKESEKNIQEYVTETEESIQRYEAGERSNPSQAIQTIEHLMMEHIDDKNPDVEFTEGVTMSQAREVLDRTSPGIIQYMQERAENPELNESLDKRNYEKDKVVLAEYRRNKCMFQSLAKVLEDETLSPVRQMEECANILGQYYRASIKSDFLTKSICGSLFEKYLDPEVELGQEFANSSPSLDFRMKYVIK